MKPFPPREKKRPLFLEMNMILDIDEGNLHFIIEESS